MDIIINDPGIAAAATETRAAVIVEGVNGLNLGQYDLTDTSAANVQIFQDTLSKLHLVDTHANLCVQFNQSCALTSLSQVTNEIKAGFAIQNTLGVTLGYTASDSNTANILTQANKVAMKSAAFDSNFLEMTGEPVTGVVATDVVTFNDRVVLQSSATTALKSVGATVTGYSLWTPQLSNLDVVSDTTQKLYQTTVNTTAQVSASLSALALQPADLLAYPTPPISANVATETTAFVNAIKAVTPKFGVLTSDYVGKKVTDVVRTLLKKGSEVAAYQTAMGLVKTACTQYVTAVVAVGEQTTLKTACTTFNALAAQGPGLKGVCTSIYFYEAVSNTVRFTGSLPAAALPGGALGTVDIMRKGCEALHGIWKPDGSGVMSFNYGVFTATPAAWTLFALTTPSVADAFDLVSSSPQAWVAWP